MTPLNSAKQEIGSAMLSAYVLDDLEDFCLETARPQIKQKKIRKEYARPRMGSTWHHVDDALEQIVEENRA